MPQKFLNNYRTTVAAQLLVAGNSLVVADATALGVVTPTDFVKLTLVKRSGNEETAWEIVRVTARSGNTLTITRGEEGTTPLQWEVGELVSARVTRDAMAAVTSPFTKEYDSKIALGGAHSWTVGGAPSGSPYSHGLGVAPKIVQAFLECVNPQGGYSVGDIVAVNPSINPETSNMSSGISIVVTSSELVVRMGAYDQGQLGILDKNTGVAFAALPANWRVFFRAYA